MITVESFKEYFSTRDFPFLPEDFTGTEEEKLNYVLDSDISRAIGEMEVMLPTRLFDEKALELAELYLTAHCLVGDIRRSNSGLGSTFTFPVQSRSVGSVSESYGIPQKFLENPSYSFYLTSDYGLKYLAILYPRTRGNITAIAGWTTP